MMKMNVTKASARAVSAATKSAGFSGEAVREISASLNLVLADMFALFFKTKNFHWHMSGPHFRDYHLLLDEQSVQIFAATDPVAERVRKLGGTTLRSMRHASRLQSTVDNDQDDVEPFDMLAELLDDNQQLVACLREAHDVCDRHEDVASASLIENWIDEAEGRAWYLAETVAGSGR
jgi:starvation-inducible DNA-binding protein